MTIPPSVESLAVLAAFCENRAVIVELVRRAYLLGVVDTEIGRQIARITRDELRAADEQRITQ